MEVGFCLEALEQALQVAHPEIGKSDQGALYQDRLHRTLSLSGETNAYGRTGTGTRQRLCRTAVADRQI